MERGTIRDPNGVRIAYYHDFPQLINGPVAYVIDTAEYPPAPHPDCWDYDDEDLFLVSTG